MIASFGEANLVAEVYEVRAETKLGRGAECDEDEKVRVISRLEGRHCGGKEGRYLDGRRRNENFMKRLCTCRTCQTTSTALTASKIVRGRSGFVDCGTVPTDPLLNTRQPSKTTTATTMPANGKPVLPPIDVQGPLMPPATARSPSKLRKSLSVDSFVRLTRPDEPSTSPVPATAAARYAAPPSDHPSSSPRVRTYSVSTADTSSRESPLPRTLSDPTVPPRLSKNRDRPRRTSEEPLHLNPPPTRLRPSPPNDLARTGPLPGPSQYNPFRKSSTSRARSGSLGVNNQASGVAMVINTQHVSVCF